MRTELLSWQDDGPRNRPDAMELVLVERVHKGPGEAVTPAYWDGEGCWCDDRGDPLEGQVIAWAPWPAGPGKGGAAC